MSAITFSIADLFEKAFGYKTQAFAPDFNTVPGRDTQSGLSRAEYGAHGSPYYAEDALGREYFLPVKIIYPDIGNELNATDPGAQREWMLPYPVISVTTKKTIVETALTERRGTVKEIVNIQDYEIIIKGFIVGNDNEFPEQEITTLRSVYELNAPVSIQCPLTDIFLLRPDRSGSDQAVIRELKFPALPGVKHVRPYELSMVSDEPFNLISIS